MNGILRPGTSTRMHFRVRRISEAVRVGLDDTCSTLVFFEEISAFYRNLLRLNLQEYESQLARKTIAHPAQNRHYSSNVRERHPRGCPTGVALTRRQVSVPWGVKSVTNSSRYNTQRDKVSATAAVSELLRSAASVRHFVNSTTRAQKLTTPSAINHDRQ